MWAFKKLNKQNKTCLNKFKVKNLFNFGKTPKLTNHLNYSFVFEKDRNSLKLRKNLKTVNFIWMALLVL